MVTPSVNMDFSLQKDNFRPSNSDSRRFNFFSATVQDNLRKKKSSNTPMSDMKNSDVRSSSINIEYEMLNIPDKHINSDSRNLNGFTMPNPRPKSSDRLSSIGGSSFHMMTGGIQTGKGIPLAPLTPNQK